MHHGWVGLVGLVGLSVGREVRYVWPRVNRMANTIKYCFQNISSLCLPGFCALARWYFYFCFAFVVFFRSAGGGRGGSVSLLFPSSHPPPASIVAIVRESGCFSREERQACADRLVSDCTSATAPERQHFSVSSSSW